MIILKCKNCQKSFIVPPCRKKAQFCSCQCTGKFRRGENSPLYGIKRSEASKLKMRKSKLANKNPMYGKYREESSRWNGGKRILKGYHYVLISNHPNADQNGYVLKSRLVMEKILGRYLEKSEVVHHIDGNKSNNNPENLSLFKNQNDHVRYHNLNKAYEANA